MAPEINENFETIDGAQIRRASVPTFYATSINVSMSSNSATLMFSKPVPVQVLQGNSIETGEALEPVSIMELSPQTAKDLHILLGKQLALYERDNGVLSTEYSRRVSAEDQQK